MNSIVRRKNYERDHAKQMFHDWLHHMSQEEFGMASDLEFEYNNWIKKGNTKAFLNDDSEQEIWWLDTEQEKFCINGEKWISVENAPLEDWDDMCQSDRVK